MNQILYITLIVAFASCQSIAIVDKCNCSQLLVSSDCKRNADCYWDPVTKVCLINIFSSSEVKPFFCDFITTKKDCNTNQYCAWDEIACKLFVGCEAYYYTTQSECESVQIRCTNSGDSAKPYCIQKTCGNAPKSFTTDKECKNYLKECTTLNGGGCTTIITCENIDTEGCKTLNPCGDYLYKTDSECKNISPKCTTNGEKCVSLTLCNKTNTNGGCVTGIDGYCLQKSDPKSKSCQKFSKCSDISYTTHSECQSASLQCTSNGKECIELLPCKSYTNADQCQIDKEGVIKDGDKILSTGKCQWNLTTKTCRNQMCSDFKKTTDSDCSSILSTCTSDGTQCIDKKACSSYKQTECLQGTDGKCKWITNSCKLQDCSDTSPSLCSQVNNCISDGIKCILKTNCSGYKSQISCQQNGIDGMCIWDGEKCKLIESCQTAKSQDQCIQIKIGCFWSYDDEACIPQTCQNYYTTYQKCETITTWNQNHYIVCSLENGKCKAKDPFALSIDQCYNNTVALFAWNPTKLKCKRCNKPVFDNSINNDPTSQSTQGYTICIFAIVTLIIH